MHIDVNNAFLSWSALDLLRKGAKYDIRKSYAAIGGDASKRKGVVLAKSNPAKKQGVVTAETLYAAKKKCPALRIYPPNFEFYHEMSRQMFEILYKYTKDIEIASIDECYLDYTNIKEIYGDELAFATKIQKEIYEKLGFTVNVGIANNKLCAKMASDFSKPFKIHTLYLNEVSDKMYPLKVGELFGVGKKTASLLNEMGIFTIGDLARSEVVSLKPVFKNQAEALIKAAKGEDESEVISYKVEPKCISTTTTLIKDAYHLYEIKLVVKEQASKIAADLQKENKYAYVVAALIKTKDFQNISKQIKLANPTNQAETIYEVVVEELKQIFALEGVRLVGIRVSGLVSNYYKQLSFWETNFKENL